MKRGYKKLLIFELFIFLILILNSFVWNILSSYKISIFLIVILIIFKVFFGFEKEKNRYFKDLMVEVLIFLLVFFVLYYLLGVLISFYKADNYFTFKGIKDTLIPTALYLSLREFSRFMFMRKAEGSKLLFFTTMIIFILFDITTAIYIGDFSSKYTTFLFIALNLIPAISSNASLCYLTRKTGYRPLLLYALVIGLYQYILPIVPNPNEYIASIISFILPIALCLRIHLFFKKDHKREIVREKHRKSYGTLAVATISVLILVYFTCGYFHLWAIAVASGSMSPKINKGDVVIIEKLDGKYDTLKKGQVIAFKYEGVVIVHRLIDIINEDGKYYFYTKGDANSKPDNFYLEQYMVIGKVNHRIPWVGIPTVWINEL